MLLDKLSAKLRSFPSLLIQSIYNYLFAENVQLSA